METQPALIVCIYESTLGTSAQKKFERDLAKLKRSGWSVHNKIPSSKGLFGKPRTLTVTYAHAVETQGSEPIVGEVHVYEKSVSRTPVLIVSYNPLALYNPQATQNKKKPNAFTRGLLVALAVLGPASDTYTLMGAAYQLLPKSGAPIVQQQKPGQPGGAPLQPPDELPPLDDGTQILLNRIRELITKDGEFRESLSNLILYPEHTHSYEGSKHKLLLEQIQRQLNKNPLLANNIVVLLDENPLV
jgi:hypothetical protein